MSEGQRKLRGLHDDRVHDAFEFARRYNTLLAPKGP